MNSTNRNAAAEARSVPETDQLGGRVNRENTLATEPVQGRRGGRRSRVKGDRIEREIVSRHAEIGIKAERYPLSGASRFRGSGHDIDIYAFGTDEGPLVAEVKSRRSGAGFVTLENWGEYDCLFLRRNSAEPLVLLPWRVWAAPLGRGLR
jgi:Holliday junction resolvase